MINYLHQKHIQMKYEVLVVLSTDLKFKTPDQYIVFITHTHTHRERERERAEELFFDR